VPFAVQLRSISGVHSSHHFKTWAVGMESITSPYFFP